MHLILPVALMTAAASAVLNFWLAMRVGQVRRSEQVSIGDGGNPRVIARMRAHANFAEFAPIVLVLIALVELAAGSSVWLWAASAAFVSGRVAHGLGMDSWKPGRGIGIGLTMLVMLGLAIAALVIPFRSGTRAPVPVESVPAA